jgi:hypothetical protein
MKQGSPLSAEAVLLTEISQKLDRVVAVLAAQGKDKTKQVEIPALAGNDSTFIGSVVGLAPGRVRQLDGWKRAKRTSDVPEGAPEETTQ